MRKQAWNYKSQIVPKNDSKNDSKGNFEYFKGVESRDPENSSHNVLSTIFLYCATIIKVDNIISPQAIILGLDLEQAIPDFGINLDQQIHVPDGLENGNYFDGTLGDYLNLFIINDSDGIQEIVDSLPRLTEEEFYSLA